MIYSFEQVKEYLSEILEHFDEPELGLWINGSEYMIILYENYCSFQKSGSKTEILKFASLDELYVAQVLDGIVLKNDWNTIEKLECYSFGYLNLPIEVV